MSLSWALDSQKLVCVGINHHTVQVYLNDKKYLIFKNKGLGFLTIYI